MPKYLLETDNVIEYFMRFKMIQYRSLKTLIHLATSTSMVWLLLWCGYCYGVVTVMVWLLLWCGYCYGVVTVMVWLLLWCGNCYGVVTVMVWLQCS